MTKLLSEPKEYREQKVGCHEVDDVLLNADFLYSCPFILCFVSFQSNKKEQSHLLKQEDKWKLLIWLFLGKVKSQLFQGLLIGSKLLAW